MLTVCDAAAASRFLAKLVFFWCCAKGEIESKLMTKEEEVVAWFCSRDRCRTLVEATALR